MNAPTGQDRRCRFTIWSVSQASVNSMSRISRKASGAQGNDGTELATCKKIVEQHGGSIWIGNENSETRRGTAIHFTLPLA